MIWIAILAGLIWWGGKRLGWAAHARTAGLVALYLIVLANLWLMPSARLVQGEPAEWLAVGLIGLVALAYAFGLKRLKRRSNVVAQAPDTGPFSPSELERYARHIVLREIGGAGQKRLKDARVLVVGAGGLGAPVLQYLSAAGVGTIGVIDDDTVENSNLQRQVIHGASSLGSPKVQSAARAMQDINPDITIKAYRRRFEADIADEMLAEFDMVLDGSDNFETRYAANAAAVRAGKPLISGALSQWEGQISVFDPARGAPCYACIFPQAPASGLAPSCAEAGVLSPLPGVVGSMMAVEAVKLITGAGKPLRGTMVIYDALYGETRQIGLKRRADCPVCGGGSGM